MCIYLTANVKHVLLGRENVCRSCEAVQIRKKQPRRAQSFMGLLYQFQCRLISDHAEAFLPEDRDLQLETP